jgi:uncharacterized protein
MGVFLANLFIFSGLEYMSDEQKSALSTAALDAKFTWVEHVFVENKFLGLFACLFGVSFWLFLDRANRRGASGARLFYRRLAWLFVIGAIHGWLLWCFDVLRFYALWGCLLVLFLKTSRRSLLMWALFCAIVGPALITGFRFSILTPEPPNTSLDAATLRIFATGNYAEFLRANWIYDWYLTLEVSQAAYQLAVFGRLLFGLFAARSLIFLNMKQSRPLFIRLFVAGMIVGIAGNIIHTEGYITAQSGSFFLPFARRFVAELGYFSLTVGYAAGIAILFIAGVKWIVRALSPVGRMALTCYLLQTVFGLWLFYGFMPGPHLMGEVGASWLFAIWIVGYALQILFASAWLRKFRFGPAEWAWRSLTYWTTQPMKAALVRA